MPRRGMRVRQACGDARCAWKWRRPPHLEPVTAAARSRDALHFGQLALQPPLPLHSFLPAQPLVSVLQPPLPLHSFLPLQQDLPSAAAAGASPEGAAAESAGAASAGAASVAAGAGGASAAGVLPPHAVIAPSTSPVAAAVERVFERLKAM